MRKNAYRPLHTAIMHTVWMLCVSAFFSRCTMHGSERVVHIHEGEIPVQPGDTIASLCMEHNVDLKDMVNCNDLHPPYSLVKIDKLKLPRPSDAPKPSEPRPIIASSQEWKEDNNTESNADGEPANGTNADSAWSDSTVMTPGAQQMNSTESQPTDAKNNPEQAAVPKKTKVTSTPSSIISGEFRYPSSAPMTPSLNRANAWCFRTAKGDGIVACDAGTVFFVGSMPDDSMRKGATVIIMHKGGLRSTYRGIANHAVKKGDSVKKGQKIGRAYGSMMQFELFNGRQSVNAKPYFG